MGGGSHLLPMKMWFYSTLLPSRQAWQLRTHTSIRKRLRHANCKQKWKRHAKSKKTSFQTISLIFPVMKSQGTMNPGVPSAGTIMIVLLYRLDIGDFRSLMSLERECKQRCSWRPCERGLSLNYLVWIHPHQETLKMECAHQPFILNSLKWR